MQNHIIQVNELSKVYADGSQALTNINLTINKGEIFALLGPNGAGKTTLIGIICGIVSKSSGEVLVLGKDNVIDFRFTRSQIGLVPQELSLDIFLPVIKTLEYQRGFYGHKPNAALVEEVLKALSLWDKKNTPIKELSGGMKRRVLIGKALMNEPKILFLDEPSAGVDVELRHDMWEMVRTLRDRGTTIILTTHYIEEAEEMADRIGIIDKGKIALVDDKEKLMQKLGKKTLSLQLRDPLKEIPPLLAAFDLTIDKSRPHHILYTYDAQAAHTGITALLAAIKDANLTISDLDTTTSSLEEIFVSIIENSKNS